MEDYYKILGVQSNSNSDDIKKSYRKLSLKHHPDRGGDANDFKKINEAYQTLGNPEKKRMYDMQKSNPLFGGMSDVPGNPEDIFNMMFGSSETLFLDRLETLLLRREDHLPVSAPKVVRNHMLWKL